MATVNHRLTNEAGDPLPGVAVTIQLVDVDDAALTENAYVEATQIATTKTTTTNLEGRWEVTLIANDLIAPSDTHYQVTHDLDGVFPAQFEVPDDDNPHNLKDLIFT